MLLDVTDADACDAVLDEIGADLYGLVNNAGYGMTGAIEDVTDDEARQLIETMVIAPMRLARLVLPGMRKAGRGRIVNVSSIMGLVTTPLTGWYQGAKHALEAVTDALRVEVAGDGIHVALVEPGGFRTSIWEDMERDIEKRGDSRFRIRVPPQPAGHETVVADHGRATPVREGHRAPRSRLAIRGPAISSGWTRVRSSTMDRYTPTALKDRITRIALGL